MSLPQALKSQFTKSFHYHRENYPEEDYSTTFENCMNHTEFGEGNLIAFEELFDELWIAQWEDWGYSSHSNSPNLLLICCPKSESSFETDSLLILNSTLECNFTSRQERWAYVESAPFNPVRKRGTDEKLQPAHPNRTLSDLRIEESQ